MSFFIGNYFSGNVIFFYRHPYIRLLELLLWFPISVLYTKVTVRSRVDLVGTLFFYGMSPLRPPVPTHFTHCLTTIPWCSPSEQKRADYNILRKCDLRTYDTSSRPPYIRRLEMRLCRPTTVVVVSSLLYCVLGRPCPPTCREPSPWRASCPLSLGLCCVRDPGCLFGAGVLLLMFMTSTNIVFVDTTSDVPVHVLCDRTTEVLPRPRAHHVDVSTGGPKLTG